MIKWMLWLSLIISIFIFLMLIFYLNYQEILVTYLPNSTCSIEGYTINKFYKCQLINCQCVNTNSNVYCKNIKEYSENLFLTYDSLVKPIERECNNGYMCCGTCCSTCYRTSCNNGHCTTSSYLCNCHCCRSVDNSECTNICTENYLINFSTNKEINFTQIFSDKTVMNNFIKNHKKSFECYVDYVNRIIYLDKNMTPWKVVILSLSICSIIIIFILIIINCFYPDSCCVDTFNYNNCDDCRRCDCVGCNC